MLCKAKSPEEEYDWYILVAEPGFGRKRNSPVSEPELAEMEYTCVHEILHAVHMVRNPEIHARFEREKFVVASLPEDKRTPDYERLLAAFETVADYGSLYYIDRFQGLDVFNSRHKNSLDSGTKSLQRIYLGHARKCMHHETTGRLLSGDLEEIRNIHGIRRIFTKLENYIDANPDKFAQEYNN